MKLKIFVGSYFFLLALVMLINLFFAGLIGDAKYEFNSIFNEYPDTSKVFIKNFNHTRDTVVLLHIQKTSGSSFDLDLVNTLYVHYTDEHGLRKRRSACEMIYVADRNLWRRGSNEEKGNCQWSGNTNHSLLLSWNTEFGWSCGLHPGLTDLRNCVFGRRYPNADLEIKNEEFMFVTILREPVVRFVSEWRHVFITGSVWLYEQNAESEEQKCLKSKIFFLNLLDFEIFDYF
jgi:hypothetical protein